MRIEPKPHSWTIPQKATPSFLKDTPFDPNGYRPKWLKVPWDPWIIRVGKVEQILATPCSPHPEMWVKAGFRTLPHLLYSFKGKPFLVADQFKRFGFHHGRKHKFTIPQMSGLLQGTGGHPAGGGWSKFILPGDVLLKLEWWFFIADVTTEGLLDWVSLAYEYEGCKFGENYLEADIVDGIILGGSAGDDFLCGDWTTHFAKTYNASGFWLSGPRSDDPSVSVSAYQVPWLGDADAKSVSFSLYDWSAGQIVAGPVPSRVDGGDIKEAVLTYMPFGYTRTEKIYSLLCSKSEGAVKFTALGRMYGHKSPKHGIVMDP